jgi:hypothetical protein
VHEQRRQTAKKTNSRQNEKRYIVRVDFIERLPYGCTQYDGFIQNSWKLVRQPETLLRLEPARDLSDHPATPHNRPRSQDFGWTTSISCPDEMRLKHKGCRLVSNQQRS